MKTRHSRIRLAVRLVTFALLLVAALSFPKPAAAGSYEETWKDNVRLAGPDRYQTAIAIADALAELEGGGNGSVFPNIVVASGNSYPDALSGGYFAAKKNAPILLVDSRHESLIQTYIKRRLLPGGTVWILGGTGSVSARFEQRLIASGLTVRRLGGSNRYETNLAILRETGIQGQEVLVCSGNGFADSLSASAVDKPILLVPSELSVDQLRQIRDFWATKYWIIGGTGSVPEKIAEQLRLFAPVARISGENRYSTSYQVARKFFKKAPGIVLAYGGNFPDGLAGGPFARKLGLPLLLVDNSSWKYARSYRKTKAADHSYVLGGTGVISDATVKKIMTQMEYTNLLSYELPVPTIPETHLDATSDALLFRGSATADHTYCIYGYAGNAQRTVSMERFTVTATGTYELVGNCTTLYGPLVQIYDGSAYDEISAFYQTLDSSDPGYWDELAPPACKPLLSFALQREVTRETIGLMQGKEYFVLFYYNLDDNLQIDFDRYKSISYAKLELRPAQPASTLLPLNTRDLNSVTGHAQNIYRFVPPKSGTYDLLLTDPLLPRRSSRNPLRLQVYDAASPDDYSYGKRLSLKIQRTGTEASAVLNLQGGKPYLLVLADLPDYSLQITGPDGESHDISAYDAVTGTLTKDHWWETLTYTFPADGSYTFSLKSTSSSWLSYTFTDPNTNPYLEVPQKGFSRETAIRSENVRQGETCTLTLYGGGASSVPFELTITPDP